MQGSKVYLYYPILLSRKFIPGRKDPFKDNHIEKVQFLLLCLFLCVSYHLLSHYLSSASELFTDPSGA